MPGVEWTTKNSDEGMLRHSLCASSSYRPLLHSLTRTTCSSYIDERLPELRSTLLARTPTLPALQLKVEKRVSLLSELLELKVSGTDTSSGGSDEEFLRHGL